MHIPYLNSDKNTDSLLGLTNHFTASKDWKFKAYIKKKKKICVLHKPGIVCHAEEYLLDICRM